MLQFTKMQSLGNDFVVIESLDKLFSLSPEKIRRMSDRHLGIGFDQLLVLEKSNTADFNYRIFNADGGEVEQCGNGARCVAKYIIDNKLSDKTEILLATHHGELTVRISQNEFSVDLGIPKFSAKEIPLTLKQQASYQLNFNHKPIEFQVVNLGNPHAVIIVDDVKSAAVQPIGAWLSRHDVFPQGANVSFMCVSKDHIKLRVYERGVGETLACGSGAAAAAVVAINSGQVKQNVKVTLPGGHLNIQWLGDKTPVWLTGPAQQVFVGRYLL